MKRLVSSIGWEAVVQASVGHIFVNRERDGIRFLIMRGPHSLCAYVGVPTGHRLAGRNYDDLDVTCHGGLTFSQTGDGKRWPQGWWWYGWDYGHFSDRVTFYDDPAMVHIFGPHAHPKTKRWTVKMVERDSRRTLREFIQLARRIPRKAPTAPRAPSCKAR